MTLILIRGRTPNRRPAGVNGGRDHAVAPHVAAGGGGLGDQAVGRGGGRGPTGVLLGVAPAQLLHDLGGLAIGGHVGLDGGVAQQTVVEGLLGLIGLAAGGVHHEGDAVVQEQVEVPEGAVLDAEGLEGGPVDLWGEILKQKPSGLVNVVTSAAGPVLTRGPPIG